MYTTVAYCVESGCRCEHRRGVVLYRGDSRADAERAVGESPYPAPAYRIVVEEALDAATPGRTTEK